MTASSSSQKTAAVSVWCVIATFGAYFCMYGLRKPFTAASYEDVLAWGLAFKPLAIAAQVTGYMTSKFIGIKVIAELTPRRRVLLLLSLIGIAEVALVGFALTPAPWNLMWLFVNGLPLGMVFGIVLAFLEGRRHTEALAAGLCTSFVLADGFTKSVGAELLHSGVPEFAMPASAGLLFAIPLLGFAWMLTRIPPPSAADVAARSHRTPMTRAERQALMRRYGLGLAMITVMYLLITVLRSVRSDFLPEIWAGLGVKPDASLYSRTEILVALGVLGFNSVAILIIDNRRAFFFALSLAALGPAILLVTVAGLHNGLSPFMFIVLQGIGLYLPYIVVHTTIFERLIAMTRDRGNIGYLLYVADAVGYLGYVAVLVVGSLGRPTGELLPYYEQLTLVVAIGSLAVLLPCWRFFAALETAPGPLPAGEPRPPVLLEDAAMTAET